MRRFCSVKKKRAVVSALNFGLCGLLAPATAPMQAVQLQQESHGPGGRLSGGDRAATGFRLRLRDYRNKMAHGHVVVVGSGTAMTSLPSLIEVAANELLSAYRRTQVALEETCVYLEGGDLVHDFDMLAPDDAVYFAFTTNHSYELPRPYQIQLKRVDVLQISNIHQVDQYFGANVYFEFILKNGALDTELIQPGVVPPGVGARPNAAWYLERMQVINGREVEVLERVVRPHENGKVRSRCSSASLCTETARF